MITLTDLQMIMPHAGRRAQIYLQPLNMAMDACEIDTPARQAAFLAQIAHESGSLRYVEEIASGEAYEGRASLGNTQAGDGVKFKGRGLIQITGRANYAACSVALFEDGRLLEQPELLEEPELAALSAGWFWKTHGLNELADEEQFRTITKRINGGFNGLDDRIAFWSRAREVLA
jgi:putative chitinase